MGGAIVKYNLPCTAEDGSCGSSDGMCQYFDGGRFCHKCQGHDNTGKTSGGWTDIPKTPKKTKEVDLTFYHSATYQGIPDRRIDEATCKKFGVKTDSMGRHLFPGYSKEGELIAVKVVTPETKDTQKSMYSVGPWSSGVLFGANSFPKTGRYLTVTEGEYDALAAYRLSGSKYPCVSILNGAGSAKKDLERNFEEVNAYDAIVFNFDNDPPGKQATEAVAPLFPGKSRIMQLVDGKDACDYLVLNKVGQYVDEFFKAKHYTLGGLVNGRDTWDEYKKNRDTPSIAFPEDWAGLNEKTYGVRLGEIIMIVAGTGTGKTQVLRELKYDWLRNTDYNILDIALEENYGFSAGGLMALHVNKRIHLPDVYISEEDEKAAHTELFDGGQIFFDDHAGAFGDDSLLDRINYAATVEKCKLIFLDHITIAVSDGVPGQENMTMDKFMNKLLQMVKRLNICIIVVSHLRKVGTGGKSFEEGRIPCEDDLKGSGSLKQISMTTIALARDKYEPDERVRNTTSLHVLKCRFSGRSGPSGHLYFDDKTGRLISVDPEEFFNEDRLEVLGKGGFKDESGEF